MCIFGIEPNRGICGGRQLQLWFGVRVGRRDDRPYDRGQELCAMLADSSLLAFQENTKRR